VEARNESDEDIHGWDWGAASESPMPGLRPPEMPGQRFRGTSPSPPTPLLSPNHAPGGLRVTRTGFNTYSLTGTVGGPQPDAGVEAPDPGFNGLNSVFQLLQNATAAPPTNTGARTMRFTSPNMNATVTVQSRTFGSGGRDLRDVERSMDNIAAHQHEMDHLHQ
jgi:hypothetical protein